MGEADERLDPQALGLDRPLLAQLAGERVDRALADVDRAARAERPAPGPGGEPRRPAAGEPAALAVAGQAHRGDRARRVALDEAQRPAHRLQVEHAAAPSRLLVADEAGGEPVVARRAPVAQRGDRGVGRLAALGRRRVVLVAPARLDVVGRPRAAGEDGGSGAHRSLRVRSSPHARAQPLGLGIRGRGLLDGRRARGRARPRRAARLRRDRARGAGAVRSVGAARPARRVPAAPRRDLHGRPRGPRRATPAASPTSTPSAGCAGATSTSPTSSPARATRARSRHVLEWAGAANAAVIPYGGGTSVVGGVEPRVPERFDGAVTIDLGAIDKLREVDEVSRAARIGAGASGPRIEEQLAAHGLTLRFFPQSFELSTLGGWIATRAGGHFATHLTHIDDLVESVRAVGPAGDWVSRRLPGSGAGPSPDRLLLGSEGILGRHHRGVGPRAAAAGPPRGARVRFASFLGGAEAVRALAQSELEPANCRLIDALEAAQTAPATGATRCSRSASSPPTTRSTPWLERALEICREHGGDWDEHGGDARRRRGRLVARGVPPHAVPARPARAPGRLHRHVRVGGDVGALPGVPRVGDGGGRGGARRAVPRHVPPHARLPDGPAPYFTVLAPARRGDEVAQWHEMKAAAGRAILDAGGTITHHHGVGRDHRPWYDAPAPGRVRGGAARGQGARSTRRAAQSRAC